MTTLAVYMVGAVWGFALGVVVSVGAMRFKHEDD